MGTTELYHFSEDPSIGYFKPHVPATNPAHDPAVWAIDEDHAPLYWFPRDCPRVAIWPRNDVERAHFERMLKTTAPRMHAIEDRWLGAMGTTTLYRYVFDVEPFVPWPYASGQWISETVVEPMRVEPVGDLLDLHARAGIELRVLPSLWQLHDVAVSDKWEFSIVDMRNAQRRPPVASDSIHARPDR